MDGRSVEVFQDANQEWWWHVRAANGVDILSDSGEGYVHHRDALAMAAELHPGLPIVDITIKQPQDS